MITHHDRLTVIARLRLLDPSQDAQALNRALTAFLSGQPTALIEHTNIPRAQVRLALRQPSGWRRIRALHMYLDWAGVPA
jgi:hypothetical protein